MDENDTIDNLRAIIISSKGGLPIRSIERDYRETFGSGVPFTSFGCKSLDEFFRKCSSDFLVKDGLVQAIPKTSSKHITELVSKQRSGRSSHGRLSRSRRRPPVVAKRQFLIPPPRFQKSSAFSVKNDKYEPSTRDVKLANAFKEKLVIEIRPDVKPVEKPRRKLWRSEKSKREEISTTGSIRERLMQADECTQDVVNELATKKMVEGTARDLFPAVSEPFLKNTYSAKPRRVLQTYKPNITNLQSPTSDVKCSELFPSETIQQFPDISVPVLPVKGAQARLMRLTYRQNSFQEQSATDYIIKLLDICVDRALGPPEYILTQTESVDEGLVHYCTVNIGNKLKFTSHPVGVTNEQSAKVLAAKKAYNALLVQNTPEEEQFLSRIYQMVKDSMYGIWSMKLPDVYLKKYQQPIAANWLSVVSNSVKFELESIGGQNVIKLSKSYDADAVVKQEAHLSPQTQSVTEPVELSITTQPAPSLELESRLLSPTSSTASSDSAVKTDDSGSSVVLQASPDIKDMPPLAFPNSLHWDVYITYLKSSSQVWCRLIGPEYSDAFDNVIVDVEMSMMNGGVSVDEPLLDHVYLQSANELISRVQVVSVDTDSCTCTTFHIDDGEEEDGVSYDQLYQLEPKFAVLPAQAICVSLHGIEDMIGVELLAEQILHKVYVAEVVSHPADDSGNSMGSVILWDTSQPGVDIDVNSHLFKETCSLMREPTLAKVDQAKEMYVSNITDDGDVHLYSDKTGIELIETLIVKQLNKQLDTSLVLAGEALDTNKLYLARSPRSQIYFRAKVLNKESKTVVKCLFVDYGLVESVYLGDVYLLDGIDPLLCDIPPQCVRSKLAGSDRLDEHSLDVIRQHVTPDQALLVKVTREFKVELYKRTSPNSQLMSVTSLVANNNVTKLNGAAEKMVANGKHVTEVKRRRLPQPELPNAGEYLNVIVSLAAHPELFMVRRLDSDAELNELMVNLQTLCKETRLTELGPDMFEQGEMYAVYYKNAWYRCTLQNVIGSCLASVYLCDFGDFVMVNIEDLIELPTSTLDLPYQAIKAKLAGIAPADKDWTPHDCLFFRNTVVNKDFVSYVVDVSKKESSTSGDEVLLSLKLVDTSTEEDIIINDLLVVKGIAVPVTGITQS